MVASLRLPSLAEEVPVLFRPNRRSRKYVLKVAADGSVQITIPRFGSRRFALHFAGEQSQWLVDQLSRLKKADREWEAGGEFLYKGRPVRAVIEETEKGPVASWEGGRFALTSDEGLRAGIVRSLREIAAEELPVRLTERALALDLAAAVSRVTIRDQRTRWGSCSARGVVSLNWRLIQMPPWVADSILIHELAHLRELNHSSRFWKIVAEADPRWRESKDWLRRHRGSLL